MIIFHRRKWRKEKEKMVVFLRLQVFFWSGVLKMFLGWSDVLKKMVVKLMYRQRGRFSQSFVNISMAGMAFLAIVFSGKVEELLATDKKELGGGGYLLMDADGVGGVNTLISDLPKGEITEYRVMEGDTVSSIAAKFGVSIDTIIWENDLKSVDSIKPKQILRILPEVGMRHVVKRGETVYSVAKKYQSGAQAIIDYPFNTFADDEIFSLIAGQELFVPDGIKPKQIVIDTQRYVAKMVAPIPGVQGEGNFMWPTSGKISQGYRWYHRAVDIASKDSPNILASQGGTVVAAGWSGGYGNMVTIDHGNGYQTVYAHMKTGTMVVGAGQRVAQGQKLGIMGSTGRSTGPHLHFEVISAQGKVNPLTVLK